MCHLLWSNLMWVFTHGQCGPWSKLTQKHVMFWWWPNISFGWSKIMHLERWASKLEPWKLPPTKTCQVLMGGPTCISMPGQPKPPKHVKFWELCFGPMRPYFMFPHVIPIHAPRRIHDALNLFQLRIVTMYFSTELWPFHHHSPTIDLLRVLITKKAHGGIKEILSFHPH
jgi:hypothetical protein